jgi:hypothetical protein
MQQKSLRYFSCPKNPGKTPKSTSIYFLFIYPVLPTGLLFGRITQTESAEKSVRQGNLRQNLRRIFKNKG